MEAKQRDQNKMTYVQGELLRLNLNVTDPEVVEALLERTEGKERDAFALAALRVGVIALKHANSSIDLERLRDEGGRLVENLQDRVKAHREELEKTVAATLDQFLNPEQGHLSTRLKRLVEDGGELTRVLESHVSGEDSQLAKVLALRVGEESPLLKHFDPNSKSGVIANIEGAVEKLLTEQREAVLGQFTLDDEDSALSKLLRGVAELNSELGEHFDLNSEKSALSRLREMLEATKQQIHKDLTLDEETSALSKLQRTLSKQIDDLVEQQIAFQKQVGETLAAISAKKEEREAGTRHGFDFEDETAEAFSRYFKHDRVERVGELNGALNRKIGDLLITLGEDAAVPGGKIAVEAKQDASYNLMAKATADLPLAMKNRDAEVGIFVLSGRTIEGIEESGKKHDWQRTLTRQGNEIYVVWHPDRALSGAVLEAACSLALALVTRSRAESDESSDVDWAAITKSMNEIEKQSERFENLYKHCDSIDSSVESIREELRKIGKQLKWKAGNLRVELERLREEQE